MRCGDPYENEHEYFEKAKQILSMIGSERGRGRVRPDRCDGKMHEWQMERCLEEDGVGEHGG